MPDEYTISSMTLSSGITNNDLLELATPDQSSETGYSSVSATVIMLATKMLKGILFSSDLNTTDKTIIGAINEILAGGGGSASILYGTSAPTAQQGSNGNLYVQYTAGTGGADDTVDALYVKLDGSWCEIETGGGGSGGHTIVDDSGTALTQRTNLQFKGAYSEDNATDDTTEIDVVREMTKAEFDQLTEAEKTGFINITDITGGNDDRFQPVIYSEEERVIGVWIDGKPLYEKTYHQTSLSIASNTELTIDDFTSKFPVSCYGVMQDTTDGRTYYPSWSYGSSSNYNIYYKKKNNGVLVLSSENDTWGNTWELFTVVRYTKDSDTAGSGQWTPQGVPAVHYSTDEQVIGTWIDGSTLYEKTIVGDSTYDQQFSYIPHGITNLDKIIDYFGYCIYASTEFSIIPYLRGSTYITVTTWDSTNIRVEKTGLSSSFTGVRLVIRYTKSST